MAAAVVSVVVEDILKSLGEGMKLGNQWGIEHELREIHDLLSSIQGVLTEAENKYGHSLKLQEWVRDLKKTAFHAEQLIQELSTQDALRQREWKLYRLFRAIYRLMFRWRMREELRAVVIRVIDRVKFKRRTHVELMAVVRRMQDLITSDRISFVRNIPAEIVEAHEEVCTVPLIGRDYEKGELMRLLLNRDSKRKRDLPVVIVHGSRGMGKTALVQEVLSKSELNRHFHDIIWVDASPPFDENRMSRDIIANLTNGVATEEENVVEELLLVRVGKLLDGRIRQQKKKYLFILENLSVQDSERQRWVRFWSFLDGGDTGSKILVTTRHHEQIYDEESVYLGDLTREDSLDLLLKTAFKGGVEEIIDPAKLQIAEEVTEKCKGNPLFVRAVGCYLSLQHSMSDWLCFRDRVNDSVLSTLLDGGYPYGHLSPMVKRYNHLSPRIKQCFGLCSLFPRGHAIDRQTLAELWIALGYINEDHRLLEVIADDYLNQLLKEDLFQIKKFDSFGNLRSVVLHPDAEDLARSAAGWECQALRWNDFPWEGVEKARHISVIDIWYFPWYEYAVSGQQTLLHFLDDTSKCEAMWNGSIPYLKNARVLDLHHRNVETVHEGVWKLKLLRYLDLSDNRRIKTLPPAITGLLNLQTLKLSGCWALEELPQDMRKMVALRHLYINGCLKLSFMPKGLRDLKFLNTLTDFILPPDDSISVHSSNLADLCKLNDLRGSLRITNLGYSESTRERFKIQGLLDKKSSLESLELIFRNLSTDKMAALFEKLRPHPNLKGLKIHNYRGVVLPEWINRSSTYLPNLVEVALIECRYLNGNYFPQFSKLRHLKSLSLEGLPNLEHMELGSGHSLSNIRDNTQPFGELSSLCIRDCPKLECLPMIPHLAKLTLVNVSEQLFRHPFYAASLKTLCLENIELLHHLPEEWLRDPTSLEELHIKSCPKLNCLSMMIPRLVKLTLATVSEELFRQPCHLPCLKTLRLENIELLHHLPEEWLRDSTSLEELHIRSCPKLNCLPTMIPSLLKMTLVNVSEDLFRKPCRLPSLKTLRLENIELLDHLPGHWLQELTSLKELYIGSCPSLVSLSRGMMRIENLVSLSIWNCKELDLSKDEHGNVMMERKGLKRLKFLTIYKASKMEFLPDWLSHVYTLRFLFIRSCPKLVVLPEWIITLRLLELLELVHCPQLKSLPAGMYEFAKDYPRKLSIIGCPLLQVEGIKHSRKL